MRRFVHVSLIGVYGDTPAYPSLGYVLCGVKIGGACHQQDYARLCSAALIALGHIADSVYAGCEALFVGQEPYGIAKNAAAYAALSATTCGAASLT